MFDVKSLYFYKYLAASKGHLHANEYSNNKEPSIVIVLKTI